MTHEIPRATVLVSQSPCHLPLPPHRLLPLRPLSRLRRFRCQLLPLILPPFSAVAFGPSSASAATSSSTPPVPAASVASAISSEVCAALAAALSAPPTRAAQQQLSPLPALPPPPPPAIHPPEHAPPTAGATHEGPATLWERLAALGRQLAEMNERLRAPPAPAPRQSEPGDQQPPPAPTAREASTALQTPAPPAQHPQLEEDADVYWPAEAGADGDSADDGAVVRQCEAMLGLLKESSENAEGSTSVAAEMGFTHGEKGGMATAQRARSMVERWFDTEEENKGMIPEMRHLEASQSLSSAPLIRALAVVVWAKLQGALARASESQEWALCQLSRSSAHDLP